MKRKEADKLARQVLPNERLRQQRELHGWSQGYVAERIGAPSSYYVSRWERGIATPSPHYREKLCRLFGTNAQVLGLLPQQPISSADSSADSSPDQSLWLVPLPRHPLFTGREELLQQMREQFLSPSSRGTLPILALCGLAGVGKTQTALEYAYRQASHYRAVLWLEAQTHQHFAASVVLLVQQLVWPQPAPTESGAGLAVLQHWLATHRDWLLILDAVEELPPLAPLLSAPGHGHLLLTSRRSRLGPWVPSLQLAPLSWQPALLLLLRRAGMLSPDASPEQLTAFEQQAPDEYASAQLLALELEGLPLALDQVGAYVQETGCRLSEYWQLAHRYPRRLLARRGTSALFHPDSLFSSWSRSMTQLEQSHPVAADVLRLCAFVHPTAIPEALFTQGAHLLGEPLSLELSDRLVWQEALGTLSASCLLSRDPKARSLSLPPIVQVLLRQSLQEAEVQRWGRRALLLLSAALPEPRCEHWPRFEQYLPHVLAALSEHEVLAAAPAQSMQLLFKVGWYLEQRGRWSEAQGLLSRALLFAMAQQGREQPLLSRILLCLANVYRHQGHYQAAEALLHWALNMDENLLHDTDQGRAALLNSLAMCYWESGKWAEAEPLVQQGLSLLQQQGEPDQGELSLLLTTLAVVQQEQGDYQHAERLLHRALESGARSKRANPFETALTQNHLGRLYLRWGKYEQAEPFLLQALATHERLFGTHHPRTASSLQAIGQLSLEQGAYAQAEGYLRRALVSGQLYGQAAHLTTALSCWSLGELFLRQQRYEQAEPFFGQALPILERRLGPTHPTTAQCLQDYREVLRSLGRIEEAEYSITQIIEVTRKQQNSL